MAKNVISLEKMTPEAIQSYVLNQTAMNPLTIYPMFVALGLTAFWFIFNATWFFLLGGGLALVVGFSNFALNYFVRFDVHRSTYFKQLRADTEREAKSKLNKVSAYLSSRDFEQGSAQVEKLQDKMRGFKEVLAAKFDEGEMAFVRYLSVAEQAEMKALENLEQVVIELTAIDNIDTDYILNRQNELDVIKNKKGGWSDRQAEESESLGERILLHKDHTKRAEDLLSLNEKAMTEIDKLGSKLARAKTSGDDVEDGLQQALDRLNDLGEEAEKNWS